MFSKRSCVCIPQSRSTLVRLYETRSCQWEVDQIYNHVFVPKGAAVAYSVYSMHRRPDFYGMDAELFRPERWTEDMSLNEDSINAKYGYLPFNGGPRLCLGMDFGLTEAAYVVVRLLQRFPQLGLPAGENVELVGVEKQTMTLVMSSTKGCRVSIVPN